MVDAQTAGHSVNYKSIHASLAIVQQHTEWPLSRFPQLFMALLPMLQCPLQTYSSIKQWRSCRLKEGNGQFILTTLFPWHFPEFWSNTWCFRVSRQVVTPNINAQLPQTLLNFKAVFLITKQVLNNESVMHSFRRQHTEFWLALLQNSLHQWKFMVLDTDTGLTGQSLFWYKVWLTISLITGQV